MKLQSIVLYLSGIGMLIFGNRDFLDKIKAQKAQEKEAENLKSESKKESEKKFETQVLSFDAKTSTWRNPNIYFQIINAGNPNFKALKSVQNDKKNDDDKTERASDSQ